MFLVNIRRFCTSSPQVRVRFAPSPTGQLHLGGLRSALFNYLFARANKGKFILRIEDTDQTRLVPGAVDAMERILDWLGLDRDEGPTTGGEFGSYFQSERLDLYKESAEKLVKNGHAYPCFCSEDRLYLLRKEALRNRQVPRYDGKCRGLEPCQAADRIANGERHVIRFKIDTDLPGDFTDLAYGQMDKAIQEGDPVLLKSDRFPTYHLANVVDDRHMQISHVIRGSEWLSATSKHVKMYRAFGWQPPVYGHLSLLTNSKGRKLSKKHGDVFVESYEKNGILPISLINFVTRNGDGFRNRDEKVLYSLQELIEMVDLNRLGRRSITVDFAWLSHYNGLALCGSDVNNLVDMVIKMIKERLGSRLENMPEELDVLQPDYVKKVIEYGLNEGRIYQLTDLFDEQYLFFWTIPQKSINVEQYFPKEVAKNILNDLKLKLQSGTDLEELSEFLKTYRESHNFKGRDFFHFLRCSLSGESSGPPVAEMFHMLGGKISVSRLDYCIKNCLE